MQTPDIITFDCYGTLIDWESGISSAFADAAALAGGSLSRQNIFQSYAAIEPVVEGGRYRSYRDVLTETAIRVAADLDWTIDPVGARFLSDSLPSWKPFPDTNIALERLRERGVRLAILSNVDDDLIAETCRHFTVPFEFIVTAQQVKSYKPAEGHFLAARERIGDARWLHAGASIFHDIVPTRRLGVANAWINRKGELVPSSDEARPALVFTNLAGLAEFLA
ncbi:MAG TPA: HAD-IA family hydrolase [Thermoanaerobaculia bacterium]|nr:HAD-IA family hydrolase [Thermoanaerobaculia bacterium]